MEKKELQFIEVMDIYAFRVRGRQVTPATGCLGRCTALQAAPRSLQGDHIAIPKTNGYQSCTPPGGPTGTGGGADPHRVHGIRWPTRASPPTGPTMQDGDSSAPRLQIRAQRWMQSLLELQQSAGSSFEFIEGSRPTSSPTRSIAFTGGRIMELPAGATPVDFAYTVHTDIGHACVGSRVDRHPYPLSSPLHPVRRWRSSRPPAPARTRPGSTSW